MNEPPPERFARTAPRWQRIGVPIATVLLGSLLTIVPVITLNPALPPFGLMVLLAWRLLRPEVFPVWAAAPFGFFDDLVSGQPLGSAVFLWTVSFFAIEIFDTRLIWRDFWQDWLIAALALAFCLIGGRLIASPIAAHVDTMLLVQILLSVSLFPLIARLVAWLDRKRGRA
ncbi:MAG: rod shape-determining protein MreD [Sphingomonas sp.]